MFNFFRTLNSKAMKHSFYKILGGILMAWVTWGYSGYGQSNDLPEVSISALPQSTEEFSALQAKLADSPQGGAALFVVATILYAENPTLGEQCLVLACDASLLSKVSKGGYQGMGFGASTKFLIEQLDSKKHVPYSYLKGTSPENGYKVALPWVVQTQTNPYSGNEKDGKIKLFVKCSGADSPRPISLAKDGQGIWKATEFSSLMVGIRAPK